MSLKVDFTNQIEKSCFSDDGPPFYKPIIILSHTFWPLPYVCTMYVCEHLRKFPYSQPCGVLHGQIKVPSIQIRECVSSHIVNHVVCYMGRSDFKCHIFRCTFGMLCVVWVRICGAFPDPVSIYVQWNLSIKDTLGP